LNAIPAQAKKIVALSNEDFSCLTPSLEYSFVLSEDIKLDNKNKIETGSLIKGKINKIAPAKRLKRDGYIVFTVSSYTVPSQSNKTVQIKSTQKNKIKKLEKFEPLSKKDIAKSAGTSVVNLIVPGLSKGITFVDGVAHPQKGESRIHSGLRHIVETWPLCYCLKGDEFEVSNEANIIFYINKKTFEM
jgi:hypothetical protein